MSTPRLKRAEIMELMWAYADAQSGPPYKSEDASRKMSERLREYIPDEVPWKVAWDALHRMVRAFRSDSGSMESRREREAALAQARRALAGKPPADAKWDQIREALTFVRVNIKDGNIGDDAILRLDLVRSILAFEGMDPDQIEEQERKVG